MFYFAHSAVEDTVTNNELGNHMYGYPYPNDIWAWLMMALMTLAFIGVVVFIAHLLGRSDKNDPLEEAKRRYARGEISKKELEKIKKDLK